jgi:hypothetical protein
MTINESMALKSPKDNKEIIIPQADKGNCTVVLKSHIPGEEIQSTRIRGL